MSPGQLASGLRTLTVEAINQPNKPHFLNLARGLLIGMKFSTPQPGAQEYHNANGTVGGLSMVICRKVAKEGDKGASRQEWLTVTQNSDFAKRWELDPKPYAHDYYVGWIASLPLTLDDLTPFQTGAPIK